MTYLEAYNYLKKMRAGRRAKNAIVPDQRNVLSALTIALETMLDMSGSFHPDEMINDQHPRGNKPATLGR